MFIKHLVKKDLKGIHDDFDTIRDEIKAQVKESSLSDRMATKVVVVLLTVKYCNEVFKDYFIFDYQALQDYVVDLINQNSVENTPKKNSSALLPRSF